jgi:Bacterial capsule synthesis protein PGA_cap
MTMSPSPRRPSHTTLYRSAGTYRRRRLRALLAVGLVVFAAVVVAGVWAWTRGGGDSPAHALAEASATAKATLPPSSAATPPPSPSPSATKTVITIGWVGDTTPGSRYGNPPDGGRALFAQVRDELRAPDLMLANLEGTYSDGGASKCDGSDSSACFAFQAPPSFAKALPWAGIDLVNMANNHANDYFQSGIDQTTAALKKNDVEYTGLPDQITTIEVKGVKVAVHPGGEGARQTSLRGGGRGRRGDARRRRRVGQDAHAARH